MLPIHAPLARRASASHARSALPGAPVVRRRRGARSRRRHAAAPRRQPDRARRPRVAGTGRTVPVAERVTLQTIADALGVSRTTVSNAYNRPDQLAPELRRKVLETAERLGYAGPDPAARRLRSRPGAAPSG